MPDPEKSDIFFAASNDAGDSFGETVNLGNNKGESVNPYASASNRSVYVVWQDNALTANKTSDTSTSDILFISDNDGDFNSGEIQNLSNNTGYSTMPETFASANNVYVAWWDNTPGVIDLLFRSAPTQKCLLIFPGCMMEKE